MIRDGLEQRPLDLAPRHVGGVGDATRAVAAAGVVDGRGTVGTVGVRPTTTP